jgi:hypothetical protein
MGGIGKRITDWGQTQGKSADPILEKKKITAKKGWGVAQVVAYIASIRLNSNPNTIKKRENVPFSVLSFFPRLVDILIKQNV